MGENITTRHIRLAGIDTGTVLQLGPHARIQLTGLRSPCVKIERFRRGLRRAVTWQRNGLAAVKRAVMAVVVTSGTVSAGDVIQIIERKSAPRRALSLV